MSQLNEHAIKKLIINWECSSSATARASNNFMTTKKMFKKLIKFELYCLAIKLKITSPDFV